MKTPVQNTGVFYFMFMEELCFGDGDKSIGRHPYDVAIRLDEIWASRLYKK
jgi:hypothetical protein